MRCAEVVAPYGMVCAMIFSIAFGLILCYDIACGSHFYQQDK